jgi:hypothetical protein
MDINQQVNNIWIKNIFKSYLWLFLPITFLGSISSCDSYIEAGTHLTESSVSVRGYYRNDGTYVRPYNRRPPGGAQHDKPYESKRHFMGILFLGCIVGGCISVFYYIETSKNEANYLIHEFEKEQERKRLEIKNKMIVDIMTKIRFDFLPLKNIPFGLSLGYIYQNCKFCNCSLYNRYYHISYKAIKYTHYICVDCLKKRDSLGRGQPRDKYVDAINYTILFDNQLKLFSRNFTELNDSSGIIFSQEEIIHIFLNNILK